MNLKDYLKVPFILLILLYDNGYCQTLPDPGPNPPTGINCDYGPRNTEDGSNPHLGLDYDIRTFNWAFAIESGTILDIQSLSSNAPTILIGDASHFWRYRHFYYGTTSDQLWSVKVKNGTNIIIIRKMENGILKTSKVYASENFNPQISPYFDSLTSQSISISTFVNQGDSIFVAKDGQLGNHLHLDRGANNMTNPLKYIIHPDGATGNFIITPKFKRNINNIAQEITDSIIYGTMTMLQTFVNSTTDHDFDKLSIQLGYAGQNFKEIKKWKYTGTTFNATTHEIDGVPIYLHSTTPAMENDVREGIYPFSGTQSKEYFKYFWNSQFSMSNSNVLNLVNKDGNYTFKYIAADITNHSNFVTKNAILDNTQPYIKRCVMRVAGQQYEAGRQWVSQWQQNGIHDGYLKFYSNNYDVYTTYNGVYIEVEASEAMKEMNISVAGLAGSFSHYEVSADKCIWKFLIPSAKIVQLVNNNSFGKRDISITGKDIAGNLLMATSNHDDIPSANIPIRNNDGSWNTKSEENKGNGEHSFYIGTGNGNGAVNLDADFMSEQTSNTPNASVRFMDKSTGNPASWSWTFDGGSPANSTLQNPIITFFSSGQHNVSLIVTDANGNQSIESKAIFITEQIPGNISITASSSPVTDYKYEFVVDVLYPEKFTSEIIINYGDGQSAIADNGIPVEHEYSKPNNTTVFYPYAEVSVYDEWNNIIIQKNAYFNSVTISPAFYDLDLNISCSPAIVYPATGVTFDGTVAQASGIVNWYWSINKQPNDLNNCNCNQNTCNCELKQSSNLKSTTSAYSFAEEGQYQISLWAIDESGHQGFKSFIINVAYPADPCVYGIIYDNSCLGQYYFPKGITEMNVFYTATTFVYSSACYDPIFRWLYDDIYSVKIYKDNVLKFSTYFPLEWSWVSFNERYYCFTGFNEEKEYELRIDFQAGNYTTYNNYYVCYNVEPVSSGGITSVRKKIKIIDCNKEFTVSNQADFNALNGYKESGKVLITPGENNSIVLDSGKSFITKANTKISLTPGVHLKYGSHFKAIPTGCPIFPNDCQCYTSPNDETANGFYPHLNKNASILVYPNPANDRLNIVSMNDDDITSLEIFNINGACIFSKKEEFSKNNVINMEGFANGIYIIKILTDKEVITKRIIKEE